MSSEDTHPFDLNFCFPVWDLENDRVKLAPFIPSIHASLFFERSRPHPELFTYLPYGPFTSVQDLMSQFIQPRILDDPTAVLFAIFDKTRSDKNVEGEMEKTFAGVIGYLMSSPLNLSTEIGCLTILPSFQRTHVTSNACGLLLQHAFSLPYSPLPGLGLRRVQWQTNQRNTASLDCAKRLGFKFEGIKRWDRVLPKGKDAAGNGGAVREGDSKAGCVGRDTALFGLCWDEWEGEERERMQIIMDRRS